MPTQKELYDESPWRCKYCSEVVQFAKVRRQFCGSSHAAKFNVALRKRKIRTCYCGAEFTGRAKCCSEECAKRKMGDSSRVVSFEDAGSDLTRKRFLLKERGHRCEECFLTHWREKPIPIELSHEDGNSDHSTRDNLKLLCRNCHGLRADHKGGARGQINKRLRKPSARNVMRRRRYAECKTW